MNRPTKNQPAVLRVRELCFAYNPNEPVLEHVNLDVRQGEVHCILGPSGCGKSTLLRLVCGLERVHSGTISVSGSVVADRSCHVPPERRPIGMVFQDLALFPHKTVRNNVLFGIKRGHRRARHRIADQLLERVAMSQFADRMPHTLSGGQQQRVALARALATTPEVMLLDEPFSSLDANLRAQLRDELLDVLRTADVATLMVTHDPSEASAVADEVTWLTDAEVARCDRGSSDRNVNPTQRNACIADRRT